MRITRLIWLGHIVDKIENKHQVVQEEVRALTGPATFRFVEKGLRPGEDVYLALGQTAAGR